MMFPNLTVVVPTFGRPALVDELLESVREAARLDLVEVEILVVDSSHPEDRKRLEQVCSLHGAELLDGPATVSEKRNLGARIAKAPLVLFVDSDCRIEPGCLLAHMHALARPDVHASLGSLKFVGPRSVWFRAVVESGILHVFEPPPDELLPWGPTANLAIRRDVAVEVGFDPTLGPPGCGGEDVDFGLRLTSAGYHLLGTPAASAVHNTETWNRPGELIHRFLSYGRSDAHLVRRYRERAYLDLPSPVIVGAALIALIFFAAITAPVRVLAIPAAAFAGAVAMMASRPQGMGRVTFQLASLVFICLDLGRVREALRQRWWSTLLWRFRFRADDAELEWPGLAATARAELLAVAVAFVVLWGVS